MNMLLSPFSAPFGGFTFVKSNTRLEYLEKMQLSCWKITPQKRDF